jgi:SAM-dependent methyltransferase
MAAARVVRPFRGWPPRVPLNSNYPRLIREAATARSGPVLELGFGGGGLITQLLDDGVDAMGVELDATLVDQMNARYPGRFIHSDILALQTSTKFHLIYSANVLEHVGDPELLLRKLGSLLTDDGTLVCMTPNAGSIDARIFGPDWYQLWYPQHLLLYSAAASRLLFKRARLDLWRIHTLGSPGTSWSLSVRRRLARFGLQIEQGRATVAERAVFTAPALLAAHFGCSSELVLWARKQGPNAA